MFLASANTSLVQCEAIQKVFRESDCFRHIQHRIRIRGLVPLIRGQPSLRARSAAGSPETEALLHHHQNLQIGADELANVTKHSPLYQLAFRLFPLDCLAFCGNPRRYFPFYKDHNINRSASSNFYFSSRVSTMASILSHLSPVPTFPAYTGPYKVGTQDVEIPIPELSSPSLAPDPSISTVSFRISYPCEPVRHAQPAYWLPSPQTQVFRAYARFMGASPRLAAFLS